MRRSIVSFKSPTHFYFLFSVYFRIFDVNKDKKIDRKDLETVMKMLFGNKLDHKDMKTLGDKIFSEVIASSGEKEYLDQDDV